jgi:hypothetical protein
MPWMRKHWPNWPCGSLPPQISYEWQQRLSQRDTLLDLQQPGRHQCYALEQLPEVIVTVHTLAGHLSRPAGRRRSRADDGAAARGGVGDGQPSRCTVARA